MNSDIVILSDRIKELSHTKGQGAFVLDGELAGFSPFGDYYQYGDVVYYAATDGTNYEVGSGEYRQNGSDNELTRFPLRSSALDSGPYYLNGDSASGPTRGQQGYFYPLYLTKSAAMAVAGATSVHTHTFSGYHGVTFYMPNNHNGHAKPAGLSGVNYVASGQPFDFPDFGIKEVYVTYPGKYSVFTGYGISGYREPQTSGVAFWGSEQLLNYDADMMWSDERSNLGISQTNPQFAIDVGGDRGYSQVRASGFFGGGSGVYFSGGQPLPQDNTKTASGGRQLEPFFRNELDSTTGTNAIFYLSGIVNERICSLKQEKGTIYSGPPSGCEDAGCSPDYPTFRFLTLEDIPDLSSLYVVQDKAMVGINPATLGEGTISLYKESGVITYSDRLRYTGGRLGIGTTAPNYTLDVFDGNAGVSGNVFIDGDIYTTLNGNVHSSGGVFARTNSYFGNDVTVSGNLFVKGTTTYNDSTNVTIQDKQLELASTSGNDSSANADHLVDDGGLVVRSSGTGAVDTGDKKWTWRNATNTWTAATSNNEKLGITASGMIFNDGSAVSGAYRAGSGLSLLEAGQTFAIGNMFKIGAIDSGNAGSDGNYVTDLIHQADEIGFSGVQGISVYGSGTTNNVLELNIDASGLSGVLEYTINNSAAGYAGWKFHHPGTSVDAVGSNELLTISGVSGIVTKYIPSTNNLIVSPDALSGVLQGKIDGVSGAVVNSGNFLLDKIVDSGVLVSGFALNFTNASGDLLSERASGLISLSGNFLRDQIYASGNHMSGVFNYRLSNLTVSNFHADSIVTASEGLTTNHTDALIPTASAVKAYVDANGGGGGGGGSSYNGFKLGVSDSGVGPTDLIGSEEAIIISGVSGVQTRYIEGSNTVLIDAVSISGLLVSDYTDMFNDSTDMINASGMKVSGVAAAVSGITKLHDQQLIALSGELFGKVSVDYHLNPASIATSGERIDGSELSDSIVPTTKAVVRYVQEHVSSSGSPGITLNAGSGLTKVGNDIHMDINGSGQLKHLIFPDNYGVRLGFNAGHAGPILNNEHHYSVFIGGNAGGGSGYQIDNTILIGQDAGYRAKALTASVVIGMDAGSGIADSAYNSFLGYKTATLASGSDYNFGFGHRAGFGLTNATKCHFMGQDALHGSYDVNHVNAFGSQAGSGAVNTDDTNMIGRNAGLSASGVNYANLIGNGAGGVSSGINFSNFIGMGAGSYVSHMPESVGIGRNALNKASGAFVNAIGYQNGAASSGSDYSNFMGYEAGYALESGCVGMNLIGYRAGVHHSGLYVNAIGWQAGYSASGMHQANMMGVDAGYESSGRISASTRRGVHEIYLGSRAGYRQFSKGYNIAIGADAGREAQQPDTTISIGYNAGRGAYDSHEDVSIGKYAATGTQGTKDNVFIGVSAGVASSGCENNVSIGAFTTAYSSGTLNSVYLGSYAGQHRGWELAWRNTHNIILGYAAGQEGKGSYNTLIGSHAGNTKALTKAIVIIHNDDSASYATGRTDWISSSEVSPDEYTVTLGESFYAYGDNTRLGKKPSSVTDFDGDMLNVAATSNTTVNIKTEMHSSADTTDQIQAATDTTGKTNTIVNSHGFLQIPVASSTSGSGTDKQFFLANGSEIKRALGVVCIYQHYWWYYDGSRWKRQTAGFINV